MSLENDIKHLKNTTIWYTTAIKHLLQQLEHHLKEHKYQQALDTATRIIHDINTLDKNIKQDINTIKTQIEKTITAIKILRWKHEHS